jgi:hypothetical protein
MHYVKKCILLLICVLLVCCGNNRMGNNKKVLMPLKVGYFWNYSYTSSTDYTGNKRIHIDRTATIKESKYYMCGGTAFQNRQNGLFIGSDNYDILFKYPVNDAEIYSHGPYMISVTSETVETPAGTFNCYAYTISSKYLGSADLKSQEDIKNDLYQFKSHLCNLLFGANVDREQLRELHFSPSIPDILRQIFENNGILLTQNATQNFISYRGSDDNFFNIDDGSQRYIAQWDGDYLSIYEILCDIPDIPNDQINLFIRIFDKVNNNEWKKEGYRIKKEKNKLTIYIDLGSVAYLKPGIGLIRAMGEPFDYLSELFSPNMELISTNLIKQKRKR